VTAQDLRYGRRGGGWVPKPTAAQKAARGQCLTCRKLTARFKATNRQGDTWPMCGRCADQAERTKAAVRLEPLSTTTRETP
jgi:hypothetical protein